MAEIPEELIMLERVAEEERAKLAGLSSDEEYEAQRVRWRDAAAAFQAAVTKYVEREDVSMPRPEVERAAKAAVRCAGEDPAE
ncbi:hypothetical protein [Streptomyces sp. NPDC093223]|uniref:hypothetical protein n=1 Tax=Streptomyces sp. NPDC093223 TaxID=3366033 RepID=UPI003821848A